MTREEATKILNGILHLNYRNFWDEECDEAISMAIEALSSKAEWILCSERLPGEDGRYLVTYPLFVQKNKWVNVLWYGEPLMPNIEVKGKHFYASDLEWGDIVYDEVTAWMPLPKPYREESET